VFSAEFLCEAKLFLFLFSFSILFSISSKFLQSKNVFVSAFRMIVIHSASSTIIFKESNFSDFKVLLTTWYSVSFLSLSILAIQKF
jgi:hypothetical protein